MACHSHEDKEEDTREGEDKALAIASCIFVFIVLLIAYLIPDLHPTRKAQIWLYLSFLLLAVYTLTDGYLAKKLTVARSLYIPSLIFAVLSLIVFLLFS